MKTRAQNAETALIAAALALGAAAREPCRSCSNPECSDALNAKKEISRLKKAAHNYTLAQKRDRQEKSNRREVTPWSLR